MDHRLTALEPNTVAACIHALRTVESDLVDPSFFLEPVIGGNGKISNEIKDRLGETIQNIVGKSK